MSKDRLLSDDELAEKVNYLVGSAVLKNDKNYSWEILDLIQSQKKAFAGMIIDIDTDVDIPEALKKIYKDGYSKGYNDRAYENSYDSVDFRLAKAIAPAVAKVRSRYDKQLKALEEV